MIHMSYVHMSYQIIHIFFPVNGLVQVFWIWMQSNGLHTIPIALLVLLMLLTVQKNHSFCHQLKKKLIHVIWFSWLPQESCTTEMVFKVLLSMHFQKVEVLMKLKGLTVFLKQCVLRYCECVCCHVSSLLPGILVCSLPAGSDTEAVSPLSWKDK